LNEKNRLSGRRLAAIATLMALGCAPSHAESTAAAAEGDATAVLQEVIVTAQRRSENLQDVPIAITAVDEAALAEQRIFNVSNIESASPSIRFGLVNLPASSTNIQIRGLGTTGTARSFEGSVGTFVDGVYRTRSGEALTEFLDIDNLQILRGPQGTLFGKNTSAGALLLTSTRPAFSTLSTSYELDYGNYDEYRVKFAVNIPMSDVLAFRVAALQTDHTGYFKNVDGGSENRQKNQAVKAQALFAPNEDFSVRLIADYSLGRGDCCFGTVQIIQGPAAPLVNALSLANGYPLGSTNLDNYLASKNHPTPTDIRDYGATLLADLRLGPGTLHSVTGVRIYDLDQQEDADYSGADILNIFESFSSHLYSQEFSYTGETGGFVPSDYVFGAYASYEDIVVFRSGTHGTQAPIFWDTLLGAAGVPASFIDAAPGYFFDDNMGQVGRSYALFNHWNLKFSDHWNVLLGIRGTEDIKTGGVNSDYVRDPIFDPFAELATLPKDFESRTDTNAVTGTAGLEYHLSAAAMTYATYNHGYKAGGIVLDELGAGQLASVVFGTPATSRDPTYRPETIDAFELGAKVDWFDDRARTNAALFYNRISDQQVAQFLGLEFTVLNAPTAKTYGAELEQTFKVSPDLTWTAAGMYLPVASFGQSALLGAPLSGRRFANAPTFTGQTALDARHPITGDLAITGRLQLLYSGNQYTNTADDLTQGGYALVNTSLGLTSLRSNWTAELWAQNLLDKRYVTQHFETPLQTGTINAYVGDPRTFGITLRGKF
jgi:outer membrane receptor protein involved in Fe transport